jgi:outer membrane protein OmpA-like peptidoglycan-associated protein
MPDSYFTSSSNVLRSAQDSARTPDKTSRIDFDRFTFNTDPATLQPQSPEQLNNVATVLRAWPAVHLTTGGYTDNAGDLAYNQKLSQDRADSDNSNAKSRALNRRISMLVTAK